jgi:hypothetical protein
MDPALTFKIPNAFHFTGTRLTDPSPRHMKVQEFCTGLGVTTAARECLIRFRWDKRISFLDLSATWSPHPVASAPAVPSFGDEASDADKVPTPVSHAFVSDRQAIRALFARGLPAARVGSEDAWRSDAEKYRSYAACVETAGHLSLAWRINTDELDFIECDTLTGEGISDLGEPRSVEIVKVHFDRRSTDRNPRVERIQLYLTADIHWMEPQAEQGHPPPVYRRTEKRILIDIEPGRGPDPFDGFAAIDFGNTNSMFACLRADGNLTSDIRFVQCNQPQQAETDTIDRAIPSAVLLKSFRRNQRRDLMPAATWDIGEDALGNGPGELLLGGKRLLADPRRGEEHRVVLPGGEVSIPKDLPAELFLTRMLRAFYASELGYPKPISVTYPTTFSDAEIDRTREAVYKALRRSTFEESYLPPVEHAGDAPPNHVHNLFAKQLDAWIPRKGMLDEATAAAFYFLYRDFIRGPGRVPAAYYEYPNGINLLLYDCGGGTTDIALIHCRIAPGKKSAAKPSDAENRPSAGTPSGTTVPRANTWRLSIRVLGRTGHRDFGGDNITVATFKVLKASLAQRLSELADKPLDWANLQSDEVEWWIKENYPRVSDYVRTNWMRETNDPDRPLQPLQLSVEERQLRQATTLGFWHWAEKVKINLADAESRRGSDREENHDENHDRSKHPLAPSPDFIGNLKKLILGSQAGLDGEAVEEAIKDVISDPQFLRERVDCLIQRDIERTIVAANEMIKSRLQEATRQPYHGSANSTDLPADSLVHWLYVVGKASRYPAIRDKLSSLHIRDLVRPVEKDNADGRAARREPRSSLGGRLRLETDVLKTCVAGGAVLAMLSHRGLLDVHIEYDHDLSRRLPFSVGIDLADGYRKLYGENQRYDDLSPEWVAVAEGRRNETTMWLLRQWPGQDAVSAESPDQSAWEKFMRFDFRHPPVGPIKIEYGHDPRDTSAQATRRKTFLMTDTGGSKERVVGKEIAERTFISPPQCGNL